MKFQELQGFHNYSRGTAVRLNTVQKEWGSRVGYRTLFTSGETKSNVLKEEVTKNVEFGVEM